MKGTSLASDYQKQVEAAPQAADFAKEAGATVRTNPDGSWVATVKGDANIKRAIEMREGSRKVEVERGQKLAATRPTEKLVTAGGREVAFPAHLSERIAKKRGWKPKINWGSSRIETGPDGMLFKQFGSRGWIPTGYDAPGILKTWAERDESTGVQRDPDGNAWMKRGSEWEMC